MKLILRQYLADLRERDELDAILPDLLSEIGFTVLSSPSRGARQAGVDVAAVGPDEDDGDRRKLFLFTIKPGDLGRRDWDDGTPQATRQSLNEILDSYIHSRIPRQYQELEIAICLCTGGEMREDVRTQWAGYIQSQSQSHRHNICFREWNGDRLAELLSSGVLKEGLLETGLQADFRKSIAMVDHPDVSYRFFTQLVRGLLNHSASNRKAITRLRQVYICLWILFVWAREAGNLEAPMRASEYALLHIWNNCRSLLGLQVQRKNARLTVLQQTLMLHLLICDELITKKVGAYADKPFALSMAVTSQSSVDVNLALFEQFGRISLLGIWKHCLAGLPDAPEEHVSQLATERNQALQMAINIIECNPTLKSPIRDDFAIEIALFMILAQLCNVTNDVSGYLEEMAGRLTFAIQRRTAYPIPTHNYEELVAHPINRSDEYFEQHTRASVLYPLLVAWLDRLDLPDPRDALTDRIAKNLPNTTQQLWVPNHNTEERFWTGSTNHGTAIPSLPLCEEPPRYAEFLKKIIADHHAFYDLSTSKYGFFLPVFLLACRHYRMPIPPHLWFFETSNQDSANESTEETN